MHRFQVSGFRCQQKKSTRWVAVPNVTDFLSLVLNFSFISNKLQSQQCLIIFHQSRAAEMVQFLDNCGNHFIQRQLEMTLKRVEQALGIKHFALNIELLGDTVREYQKSISVQQHVDMNLRPGLDLRGQADRRPAINVKLTGARKNRVVMPEIRARQLPSTPVEAKKKPCRKNNFIADGVLEQRPIECGHRSAGS